MRRPGGGISGGALLQTSAQKCRLFYLSAPARRSSSLVEYAWAWSAARALAPVVKQRWNASAPICPPPREPVAGGRCGHGDQGAVCCCHGAGGALGTLAHQHQTPVCACPAQWETGAPA